MSIHRLEPHEHADPAPPASSTLTHRLDETNALFLVEVGRDLDLQPVDANNEDPGPRLRPLVGLRLRSELEQRRRTRSRLQPLVRPPEAPVPAVQ